MKVPVFDPYIRGYLLGVAAARRHGPIDADTLAKLKAIADEIRRFTHISR